MTIYYRDALSTDYDRLGTLDDSFTTDSIYQVTTEATKFTLQLAPVDPPLVKNFPHDDNESLDEDSDTEHVIVAVNDADQLCGYIVLNHEEWDKRLTIEEVVVAENYRGQRIGQGLIDQAITHGEKLGAQTLWLEVSNVNVPAIRAYLKAGFNFCGLDISLYHGTESEGETALFMAKPLQHN